MCVHSASREWLTRFELAVRCDRRVGQSLRLQVSSADGCCCSEFDHRKKGSEACGAHLVLFEGHRRVVNARIPQHRCVRTNPCWTRRMWCDIRRGPFAGEIRSFHSGPHLWKVSGWPRICDRPQCLVMMVLVWKQNMLFITLTCRISRAFDNSWLHRRGSTSALEQTPSMRGKQRTEVNALQREMQGATYTRATEPHTIIPPCAFIVSDCATGWEQCERIRRGCLCGSAP